MRSRRRLNALTAAAVGVLILLTAGCDPLAEPAPADGPADQVSTTDATLARERLGGLAVADWASMRGYSRDRFEHWRRTGENCNVRDEVLRRDAASVETRGCNVVGGRWFSPYDGETVTDPQDIDIDHMVPLANAWRTGAAGWSDADRERFANDTSTPQLLAVTASTNRSKGDQDPSQWKPPRRAFWCAYAVKWVSVKSHWRLSVTADEKAALRDMLEMC
jgi:hypothetical protein